MRKARGREEILRDMKEKYKLAFFMVVKNSIRMNKLKEYKNEKELNHIAYEAMCDILTITDFAKVKKDYEQGKETSKLMLGWEKWKI